MNWDILDFGKYIGWRLQDVPRGYLRWLLTQERLDDDLRNQIDALLAGAVEPPPSIDERIAAMFADENE